MIPLPNGKGSRGGHIQSTVYVPSLTQAALAKRELQLSQCTQTSKRERNNSENHTHTFPFVNVNTRKGLVAITAQPSILRKRRGAVTSVRLRGAGRARSGCAVCFHSADYTLSASLQPFCLAARGTGV